MGGTTTHYDPELHGDHTDFLYGQATAQGEQGALRTDRHGTDWEVLLPRTVPGEHHTLEHYALVRYRGAHQTDFNPWFLAVTALTPLDPREHGGHTLGVNQREESQNPGLIRPGRSLLLAAEQLIPLTPLSEETRAASAELEPQLQRQSGAAFLETLKALDAHDAQRHARRWRQNAWAALGTSCPDDLQGTLF